MLGALKRRIFGFFLLDYNLIANAPKTDALRAWRRKACQFVTVSKLFQKLKRLQIVTGSFRNGNDHNL